MPPKMDGPDQSKSHSCICSRKRQTLRRGKQTARRIETRQRIYFWNAKEPLAYCPKENNREEVCTKVDEDLE